MARMDDLIGYAERHGLKIGTIRDLIAYRRRYDHLLEKVTEQPFQSDYGGSWRLLTYRNRLDGSENLVLQKGVVDPDQPTLVRMHRISLHSDMLGEPGERKRLLQRAMIEVGKASAGVIVLLAPHGPASLSRAVTNRRPEDTESLRDYGVGAQILTDLGIHRMVLLTNSHRPLVALAGYGLDVVGEQSLPEYE
jgi:3,4-dihydroxy 2-butanone 4-phosphate synthase/GTP cyclohydrolase II